MKPRGVKPPDLMKLIYHFEAFNFQNGSCSCVV